MRTVPCTQLMIGVASLVVSGCTMGPDYSRPEVAFPAQYRDAPDTDDAASIADRPWWEVFQDPALVALIDEALRSNYDLQAAVSRIEQARGIQAQAGSGLYPQVGYGGAVSRGKNEFLGAASPNNGTTRTPAFLGLTAFWELDIWGRIRRADEAAYARVLAAEDDRRAIMLILVSDVAQRYFLLLGLDLQIEIAKRNTGSFGDSLGIFEERARGGLESDLSVLRAKAARASAASTLPQLEIDVTVTENALNVLLGRPPQPIVRPRPLADQAIVPEVPVGVPSQLLERRPDVRASEKRMISANASVGVALADYFPQISLTGALGRTSPELSAFSAGSSNLWSIAAGLTGPIFQGGRLKGQELTARAALAEAVANYQQNVLRAMQDVSDALIEREKLVEIEQEQITAVESLLGSVRISKDRFLSGLSSYFEVLEAQQQLFPAEQALAETRTRKLLVLVQLYRALGGGWRLEDDQWLSENMSMENAVQ